MNQNKNKSWKVSKGAPSGFVISLMVHAAAIMLAGLLVVFTVHQKEEKKFVPPKPVDRPKMKLKKPKVKVKKSAKPKATTRIVTKVKRASMPDIQLPEMSGISGDIGDGIGGFDIMPNLDEITTLGARQSIGNDLVGTYYDTKFTRKGLYNPMSDEEWRDLYYRFFKSWDTRLFYKYYKSPKKLYATTLVLPTSMSAMAPAAFGIPDDMCSGGYWIVHYKGKLVHKEDITFRFWVAVDDSLAIRVDKEVVVAASWGTRADAMYGGLWSSQSLDTGKYKYPGREATVGDWITLKAGEPKDIEIVATDNAHANADFFVMVEVQGVEYPTGVNNGPILPIFKTEKLSHDHLDLIYPTVPDGLIDFENGPVFRDY